MLEVVGYGPREFDFLRRIPTILFRPGADLLHGPRLFLLASEVHCKEIGKKREEEVSRKLEICVALRGAIEPPLEPIVRMLRLTNTNVIA